MHIIIALTIFFIALAFIAFFMRNNTLSKFQWAPNESIVKEFIGIKVSMKSLGPQTTVFNNSKLTITNKRALISQKIPFRNDFVIHYILYPQNVDDAPQTVKSIVQLNLLAEEIHPPKNEKQPLLLTFPASALVRHIELEGQNLKEIELLLRNSV